MDTELLSHFAPVGLGAAAFAAIDRLLVGCGGFVKELIVYTGGESRVKDSTGQRLSAADELVDRLLREQLEAVAPASGGYSEEGGWFGRRDAPLRWLVDPVDGTRAATLGGVFAVSVGALIEQAGRPAAAAGWVYVPTLATLFRGVIVPSAAGLRGECLRNGQPAAVETWSPGTDLGHRYLAVSSNWRSAWLGASPLKVSAPGATAVHLAQLVQPGSDVVAAALTRYQAHDAAGGLAVALAGGCALYRLEETAGRPGPRLDPMAFLKAAYDAPEQAGERTLVCRPEVAAALR
jgi:fructose-1,6-bisphosphatase/inositol monophosphatase family enzyme